jgi:hypothetical protein
VDGHHETYPIRSKGFRRWLLKSYFDQTNGSPNAEAQAAAINMLGALAQFKGEERKTFIRVGEHRDKLYLDLSTPNWQIVELGADGWRIIPSEDCPVRFRRAHGMQALSAPARGGSIKELREFVNVATDADFQLLTAALVSYYRARGPYPVLIFAGEQGTAKSTNTTVLRLLIDPNMAPLRSQPRDEQELAIAANNSWVVALNNLSSIPPWLSDTICRLATGGGFGKRELYTDSDEVIFDAQRPVILNGIDDLTTRGDLLDRAIILELPRIAEDKRLTEEEFYRRFHETRPRILGALLDAVSGGASPPAFSEARQASAHGRFREVCSSGRACPRVAPWSLHGCLCREPRSRARCCPGVQSGSGNHQRADVAFRGQRDRPALEAEYDR